MKTLTLTEVQFQAVREALDQFVQNGQEAIAFCDGDAAAAPLVAPASEVLDYMNAAVAALAETP